MARLWAWQVWRRIFRRPVLVDLGNGTQLICPPWSHLASAHIAVGLHEPGELLFVTHFLREGDWVIDVGANLGLYTTVSAFRGARVLVFEPDGAARAVLTMNVDLNHEASHVWVHDVALSDFNGTAMFTSHLDVGNHLLSPEDKNDGAYRVQVARLDDFCRANYPAVLGRASLLKIDVEGFDLQVLHGAEDMIAAAKPAVIVEIWNGGRDVRGWLESRGYRVYRYHWAERRLEEVETDFEGQANFIAVHLDSKQSVDARLWSGEDTPIKAPRVKWLN